MLLEAIYARLSAMLREQFDDDSLVARPDLTADDVAGWDSFAHLRLMFSVEQAFGVSFTAGEMSSFRNVGDLALLIAAKIQP